MKLKFLIILICIYSSLFSQNTNCTPPVEPMPSPALLIPRLIWYNQTATTLNVQKVQNNINDWTAGGMINRPIAEGESITFRSNSGIKAVGLALKKTEANMLWRQPHSVLYGFYINRWSGTAYPMETKGSADTRIDYENEGRPWNDNSVFKIKRVCNKVYYYMDDIQFPHVSTIVNSEDLYFDMNFKDVLGWVYDVTIYGACGIQDCTNGSITPTFTQIDPICAGGTFTLPTASNNTIPVTGSWSPAINNQATTTYTFTPDAGQSASTTTMTVMVNNPTVPTFTQVSPICRGGTFTLPTISNNGITGSWSPAVNNQATTEYTFTPASGQCASNTTMTVIVNNATIPTFTQVSPICAGGSFSLPTTSDNGIAGTWSPAVNNQATTEYTFTPNPGQCASNTTMTVTVNPSVSLIWSSGSNNQTVDKDVTMSSITYMFGNGASGVTVTGLPIGVSYATQGNDVTISGIPTVEGTFNYTVSTMGGCGVATAQGTITVPTPKDLKLAPNSYIFTGKDKNGNTVDGLYIPVKKAYEMWRSGNYMKGNTIPSGVISADVLWEDNMGLIKSKENYILDIVGSGENAEIKVPVNKVKEGNALISYKIDGVVYWSWHIWVTDDPTNGSTYKSYDEVKRELSNGTVETIPNSEWGWMDRNLGALGNSLNGDGWNRNGGLMYQWGRKDPFPPLTNRDASFYQITGSLGKIVYEDATARLNFPSSPFSDYKNFNSFTKLVNKSTAYITDNIRLSVKNPLSLIYVIDDNTTTLSTYSTSGVPYYYNWFGQVIGLQTSELSKTNLWSDNSLGIQADISVSQIPQPYRNKSSYDPCPNGWRLPSVLAASASKNLRMDFTPFGPKVSSPLSALNVNAGQSNIPPGLSILKPYLAGIKVYPQIGFDMTNVGGNNIGVFPGTGWIGRGNSGDNRYHLKPNFTDQLETYLWTSTMTTFSGYSSIASSLRLIPAADQIVNNYKPDATNYPNIYGLYNYKPADDFSTNDAHACRCIKDPLFVKNNYDFETKFFSETETYKVGLDNPNSYVITKSNADQVISIPVSKAFSVQSNYLGNTQILNSTSFDALKANVLWTDTPGLITQLTIDNPTSKDGNINVKINANNVGNAVVTLHNGSINNPAYWSWHIWVTNTAVNSVTYVNDTPITTDNYMNYTQYGTIMKTVIMDRNLGAIDATPSSYNPSNPTDVIQLNNSQGVHYQWGRKDPLPTFNNITPSLSKFNVFLGTTNNNGVVTYPTTLTEASFSSNNIVNYNTYKSSINTTDKIDVRIEKILGYSVANPLKFMMPTVVYPTRSDTNYILGSDWLFDTNYHALYAERWGLGDKKSVFDPCPNGWRIPETGTGNIKSSPWSLKNNNESTSQTVAPTTELGYYGSPIYSVLASPFGNTVGFVFNNSLYNTGNYPKGYIRGKRSVIAINPLDTTVNNPLVSGIPGGIWYANLQQNLTGRGTYMNLDRYARTLVKYTDVDPYAAMSCRCVKQEDIGTPRGPLPGIPVTTNTTGPSRLTLSTPEIDDMIKNKLIIFPNPVKDLLNLDAKDDKDYYYQMYNMAGQLIKEGKFNNKQTDISQLPTGAYLIRINNSESVVKIIKQ